MSVRDVTGEHKEYMLFACQRLWEDGVEEVGVDLVPVEVSPKALDSPEEVVSQKKGQDFDQVLGTGARHLDSHESSGQERRHHSRQSYYTSRRYCGGQTSELCEQAFRARCGEYCMSRV